MSLGHTASGKGSEVLASDCSRQQCQGTWFGTVTLVKHRLVPLLLQAKESPAPVPSEPLRGQETAEERKEGEDNDCW